MTDEFKLSEAEREAALEAYCDEHDVPLKAVHYAFSGAGGNSTLDLYNSVLKWLTAWQLATQAAYERAAQDAKRYRFLRDKNNPLEADAQAGISTYHMVGGVRELKWGDELDAAIDSGIRALAKGEGG